MEPTKRPSEIISAFAGSVLLAVSAFGIYEFNEEQLLAVGVLIAGVPSVVTAVVETWRSFRAPKVDTDAIGFRPE